MARHKKDPAVVYRKVLEAMGAKSVWEARTDVPRELAILRAVQEIAHKRHIIAPPVLIYDSEKPNAVSMPGAVAVATNLIDITTPQELKAVLGHEMSHTRHRWRDTPIILGIILAADLAIITVMNKLFKNRRPKNIFADGALEVTEHVVPVLGSLLAMKPYGQHMEYEADREGAEIAGPQAMGGALKALQKRSEEIRRSEPEPSWLTRVARKTNLLFFDIHPPMHSRLARMSHLEEKEQNNSFTAQRIL